jgi:nucleotide-binding universal stress UspA family protein
MFKTIVIATDGSTEADAAYAVAASMAQAENARLVVVHVVELLGGKGGRAPLHADEDEIHARIVAAVGDSKKKGVAVDLEVHQIAYGGPAHIIADIADREDADLIVVGNRGHNPVAEVVVGNVPVRLMHIAHRPVLVVPSKSVIAAN